MGSTSESLLLKGGVCGTDFSEVVTDLNEISSDGGNVIVGTPGRINDIMKKKTLLNFRSLEVHSCAVGRHLVAWLAGAGA